MTKFSRKHTHFSFAKIRFFPALSLVFFGLLGATTAWAEIYKWVDDKGETHFSNVPVDSEKSREVITIKEQNPRAKVLPASVRVNSPNRSSWGSSNSMFKPYSGTPTSPLTAKQESYNTLLEMYEKKSKRYALSREAWKRENDKISKLVSGKSEWRMRNCKKVPDKTIVTSTVPGGYNVIRTKKTVCKGIMPSKYNQVGSSGFRMKERSLLKEYKRVMKSKKGLETSLKRYQKSIDRV